MISSLYSSILRRQPRTAHCSWLARVRRIAQVRRFRMFFRPEPLKGPTMRADFMFGFHYLVGGSTPLKNMSSSVGMMTFPIYIYGWKNTIHVPNHQPVNVLLIQENRAFGFFRITNQSSEFPRLLAVTRILESVAQAKGRVQGENGSKVHNGSSRNSMVPLYRWMIWMVYEQKTLTYLEMDELGVPP